MIGGLVHHFILTNRGYKFHLAIIANGYGAGADTHVSVGVAMMKGEYDDLLAFPFHHIEIINWR